MPAQMIYSLAKKAGVSKKKAEEYWDKAKKVAGESGRNPDKTDKEADYKYVVGIVKKMMGLKESTPMEVDLVIEDVLAGLSPSEALRDLLDEDDDYTEFVEVLNEKQEPYQVAKEPYQRALDRIANLEKRGVDVEKHTMLRLKKTNKAAKIAGIFFAAKDKGLKSVAKEAKKKYKDLTGQSL